MVKQANFKAALTIQPDAMQAFTAALFEAAGASAADAKLISGLLVDNDLHGASSHGTNLAHGWRYLQQMRDGSLNPRPVVKVISETGNCRVYDGDGGCGHFACYAAMQWCIKTAKAEGCAVATTRNHHHFGAAVQWGRMASEADCIAIAVSSHRYELGSESSVSAVNGSPLPPPR
jgi:L-2-hydroxycarboxylate dehydrogenase (NAD+)